MHPAVASSTCELEVEIVRDIAGAGNVVLFKTNALQDRTSQRFILAEANSWMSHYNSWIQNLARTSTQAQYLVSSKGDNMPPLHSGVGLLRSFFDLQWTTAKKSEDSSYAPTPVPLRGQTLDSDCFCPVCQRITFHM